MASESSSAVLELNDADATDTEAPSVTDDTQEGAPLIMEHGYDIAVKVDAPMKQLSTLETFVTYRVRCACGRWGDPPPPYVRRRYNHFKLLHRRLSAAHPLTAVPPLPPLHSARQHLDRYSPPFVAVRCLALHAFLDRVAKHPILTHSEDFRLFLTTPDEELDKVFKSENSAMNLWGLSSALYGAGETKPTNGARVKDPEFASAGEYLASLQHKLNSLCALTVRLYRGSRALGDELAGMRRACLPRGAGGGRAAAAAAGCAAGGSLAGGALAAGGPGGPGGARGGAGGARGGAPLRFLAALPLLAAYAGAQADKIRARDALHAACAAGGGRPDDLRNRLEQASEALRSELSDWIPKTRAEVKSILLELADRQVSTHTRTLQGWERALHLATEDAADVFKTVSKTAVQNLSPSKCRTITTPPAERDLDDVEIENYSNDSDTCASNEKEEIDDDTKVDTKSENVLSLTDNDNKLDSSSNSKFSDPLQDFSEVDLS